MRLLVLEYHAWESKFIAGTALADDATIKPLSKNGRVFVFGMGGSAAAGTFVEALLHRRGHFSWKSCDPFESIENPGKGDLLIFVSYSGNTWEVLHAFARLQAVGADLLVIACGGKLLQQAENQNIATIVVPNSGAQPREEMGRFCGILCGVAEALNLFDDSSLVSNLTAFIQKAVDHVVKSGFEDLRLLLKEDCPEPQLWGVSGDTACVISRVQAQLNENGKMPILTANLPEAAHNVIEGFSTTSDIENRMILLLQTDFTSPDLKCAVKMLAKTLEKRGAKLYSPPVFGDTWERQLLYLVIWSDFASYWLGLERGLNPRSIDVVSEVKQAINNKCDL